MEKTVTLQLPPKPGPSTDCGLRLNGRALTFFGDKKPQLEAFNSPIDLPLPVYYMEGTRFIVAIGTLKRVDQLTVTKLWLEDERAGSSEKTHELEGGWAPPRFGTAPVSLVVEFDQEGLAKLSAQLGDGRVELS